MKFGALEVYCLELVPLDFGRDPPRSESVTASGNCFFWSSKQCTTRACNTGPISQYRYFGIGKNQYRYTGIKTGIQRLPILAVLDVTKCKQYVVNDRLMSA